MAGDDRRTMDPRNRLSTGINRRRLQQEGRRAVRPTIVFVSGLVVMIVIAGYLITSTSNVFGRSTYDVRFKVDNAFGIFAGFDDVRFRGVPAGTIQEIEREGSQIVLVARIQDKYGPVYKDARAEVRPITPLNDIYLDIVDPGTKGAGEAEAGQPLPQNQTTTSVTVPDVLDGVNADARKNAYRLLDNLGNGMADGGIKLQRAFVSLKPFVDQAADVAEQVSAHKEQTERLVHNTGVLTEELGRRELQLKRLVSTGAATVGTLQEGSGDLDRTLRELGPTFTELRASLASVRGVVDDVDSGLQSLYPVADKLPGGLGDLRQLSGTLDRTAIAAKPAIKSFFGWTQPITTVLGQAAELTTNLQPQAPTLNRTLQRLAECEDGVVGFFQWNASLSKFGDQSGGPIPRGNLAIGAPAPLGQNGALRDPEPACTPGLPTRGVPGEEDFH